MLRKLRGGPDSHELAAENERLRSENAELRATIVQQQRRIEQLEAKLGISSHNSSQPPSGDGPEVPPRTRPARGRKRGGQRGHPGTHRPLVPIERGDVVVDCRPACCGDCGALLLGEDPAPERRQVIDIPTPTFVVTEYRVHRLTCLACGQTTSGPLPADVPPGTFGVGLHALAALLVGRFRLSKRLVADLLRILYGLKLSPASVCTMERRVHAALSGPVDQVRRAIRQEEVVGQDETGWRLLRRKAWLWVAATESLAVFTISRRREGQVVRDLLGESFGGVVCADRWTAYLHCARRQICWAHVLRDFIAMIERFGSPWHGARLVTCALAVMDAYADRQAGQITHDQMVARLEPVRERTKQLLAWTATGARGADARAKARQLLRHEQHLWTFMTDARIPVTNNLCERLLRYAVILRKLSYGNDSEAGARFLECLLTTCASLQLQRREVFAFLTAAVDAHFRSQPAPSLLPPSSAS